MSSIRMRLGVTTIICSGLFVVVLAFGQAPTSGAHKQIQDRARIVRSQALPKLDGDHLKVSLVEVRYGPGEASLPHTHPCAVIAYVVEGAIRTQVKGEPERIYRAGESFYEAPNGVHLVSANASSSDPAKLVAYLICDRNVPLSVTLPKTTEPRGGPR